MKQEIEAAVLAHTGQPAEITNIEQETNRIRVNYTVGGKRYVSEWEGLSPTNSLPLIITKEIIRAARGEFRENSDHAAKYTTNQP